MPRARTGRAIAMMSRAKGGDDDDDCDMPDDEAAGLIGHGISFMMSE